MLGLYPDPHLNTVASGFDGGDCSDELVFMDNDDIIEGEQCCLVLLDAPVIY